MRKRYSETAAPENFYIRYASKRSSRFLGFQATYSCCPLRFQYRKEGGFLFLIISMRWYSLSLLVIWVDTVNNESILAKTRHFNHNCEGVHHICWGAFPKRCRKYFSSPLQILMGIPTWQRWLYIWKTLVLYSIEKDLAVSLTPLSSKFIKKLNFFAQFQGKEVSDKFNRTPLDSRIFLPPLNLSL